MRFPCLILRCFCFLARCTGTVNGAVWIFHIVLNISVVLPFVVLDIGIVSLGMVFRCGWLGWLVVRFVVIE